MDADISSQRFGNYVGKPLAELRALLDTERKLRGDKDHIALLEKEIINAERRTRNDE